MARLPSLVATIHEADAAEQRQLTIVTDGTAKGTTVILNGRHVDDVRGLTLGIDCGTGVRSRFEVVLDAEDFESAAAVAALEKSGACLTCRGTKWRERRSSDPMVYGFGHFSLNPEHLGKVPCTDCDAVGKAPKSEAGE